MSGAPVRAAGTAGIDTSRFGPLMDRYRLAVLPEGRRETFRAFVEAFVRDHGYEAWFRAWRGNRGSFLGTLCWGADREFGDGLVVKGAMDDRHVTNMERLVAGGGLEPAADVAGRACCVVGCWCGEENLLLHALGAAVADGVEEVPEYARAARMQLAAFGVPGQVRGLSLYEPAVLRACAGAYDLLYVPGVLYHLTDPVAALVVLWAMLRPGGLLAVETIVADRPGRVALYRGARDAGWNWWAPTADCWLAMMGDCGFAGCRRVDAVPGRGWFVGRRGASLPAWETGAAGFSRPDLLAEVGELCGLAAPVRASSGAGDMEGPGGSGGP